MIITNYVYCYHDHHQYYYYHVVVVCTVSNIITTKANTVPIARPITTSVAAVCF